MKSQGASEAERNDGTAEASLAFSFPLHGGSIVSARRTAVALMTLALGTSRLTAQTTLPVEYESGLMFVRTGGVFVIDLGGGTEVLSSTYAERVKRGPAGWFTGFRSTGERIDSERMHIAPITLGPITTPADAVVWRGLDGHGVDGLISARTFAHTPVTLDFANRQLVFETASSLAARERRGSVLALKTDAVRDLALDLFLDFDLGNGQVGTCEIDTGSQGVDLNARYMAVFGISPDSGDVAETRMAGSSEVFYRARVSTTLAPVGAPHLNMERPVVRFGNYIYDCVVGTEYWSRTALTIDIPRRRVILAAAGPSR